ncbi:hypothetical protein H310_00135 [Aphanomyces invadans]|uniref:Uncharacterized protein n=1 Tax=Aphanomyces invadans TaxID=157072 RepID=A0A024UUG2_9STRA|nr:hypothetical protein H310_00135 [Aphanomyces invadans]ETW09595.1 hypothetical protein H310_00135 [Aphanomyces invadans]|eukprot:XP_008861006.1 hypothetical protein H310_00135 [Aphanomyces invadans]
MTSIMKKPTSMPNRAINTEKSIVMLAGPSRTEGQEEHHEFGQHREEYHAKEQGKVGGGVAHGGFYHGEHKATANVTRNGTLSFHDGNWSNGTGGDHDITYPHQGNHSGNLSLQSIVNGEHHHALAAVGGAAVVAALGFVAFKVAKKLRHRSNYESIPSEGAHMI